MTRSQLPRWRRHCSACGAVVPLADDRCTACGALWERPSLEPGEIGRTIDLLSLAREAGEVPQFPFEATRQALERMLDRVRRRYSPSSPEGPAPAPATPPASARTEGMAARIGVSRTVGSPAQLSRRESLPAADERSRPAKPPGPPPAEVLRTWAARRQADILLYLGALLLTAAAVTFVAYQGEAVGNAWRFLIVTVYTGAFLALGLFLPRWERIREAGPVFLALGAVLVPIDFFALRAAISGADLPADVAVLIGSGACSALYFTLAARGYGRWYTVPGVPAAMLAWGALGSVLHVPGAWFGAWYEIPAGLAWLVASAVEWKPMRFLRRGAITTSVAALYYSLAAASFGESEWVVPVTLAIITVALVGGLPLRRSILAFAVLPLTAAAAVASGLQAATDFDWPWYALSLGLAGSAYLVVSEGDTARLRPFWRLAAFPVWLAGLGVAHLGFALDPVARGALPGVYLLVLAGTACGVLWWRVDWRDGLVALPVAGAGLAASLVWSLWDIPLEWLSVFAVGGAGGYLVVADYDPAWRCRWRAAALAAGGLSLAVAHFFALRDEPSVRAALPVPYLILLAGTVVDGARRRDASLLVLPVLVAATSVSVLWFFEVDEAWWAIAPVAVGLIMALLHPLWSRHAEVGEVGWAYCLALAGGPGVAFTGIHYEKNLEGLLTAFGTALTFSAAAVWSRGRAGELLREDLGWDKGQVARAERLLFGFAAAAFLFVAAGHFNAVLEIGRDERAWVFVVVAAAAWLVVAARGRERFHLALFAPVASTGFAIAAATSVEWGGTLTAVLVVATILPVVAFATTRAWLLWLVALAFATLTARAFWYWQEFDVATLPLAYAAAAIVLWAALLTVRVYGPLRSERDGVVQALSWVPWVIAGGSAVLVLDGAGDGLGPGEVLVTTREWVFAAVVLAAISASVIGEALLHRHRAATIAGSAGLMLSLLMFIGVAEPENVQAFTLPVGVYLVVLGLSFRRSEPLFGKHMAFHEAVIVAGVLTLALPPAEQSFEPGGGRYGFEIIGLGLAFLAGGFLVHARWLVPAGVLSLTGVVIRWVTGGYATVPYWLVLGILGTLLIACGVVVLFQRDAWESARERIASWWLGGLGHPA